MIILMRSYDVVAIGDALIDIFIRFHRESDDIHTATENCEVCLKLGAKIPIDHSYMTLGGDGCNVAVGTSRLGLQSALMAEVGDDDFAQKIVKDLQKEHVSEELLIQTKHTASTFSIIFSLTSDRTIFSQHVERKHNFDFSNLKTSWIYLTSLGEDWHKAYDKTLQFVKQHPVKLAFSPGSHQLKEGRESFADILPVTDILFVNREEGERIAYGHEHTIDGPQVHIDTLLADLKKLGPRIVSVTDSVRGSYAIDKDGKILSQGTMPSRTVEKTGVGDAYAAGFLAATIHGTSVQDAMKWGATNSASVIEHIGATVGLLREKEMKKRV